MCSVSCTSWMFSDKWLVPVRYSVSFTVCGRELENEHATCIIRKSQRNISAVAGYLKALAEAAGVGDVEVDATSHRVHPLCTEDAAQTHGTVPGVLLNGTLRHQLRLRHRLRHWLRHGAAEPTEREPMARSPAALLYMQLAKLLRALIYSEYVWNDTIFGNVYPFFRVPNGWASHSVNNILECRFSPLDFNKWSTHGFRPEQSESELSPESSKDRQTNATADRDGLTAADGLV